MEHQFYLLDDEDHIRAVEVFSAPDDITAAEIGNLAYESCADAFSGFELWRGTRRITGGKCVRHPRPLLDVSIARHQTALDLLERIQSEFESVKRSTRLAKIIADIRETPTVDESAEY